MNKFENCILLVCNKPFLVYTLFLANKLLDLKNINYDVVICSGENLNDLIPQNIRFIQIDTEEFTNNLPTIPRLQHYSYWRIPAIEAASEAYSKILYLDVDIYINCKDISTLFKIDLCGQIFGAVRDVHQIARPQRMPMEFKALNKKYVNYFNAGLLLVDSKLWRKNDSYKCITGLSKKYTKFLFCHDQSLLNLYANGNWVELSPVWNWQYSDRNCFIIEIISPKLIHFSGAGKFWNISDVNIPTRFRESYYLHLHHSLPADFPCSTIGSDFFKIFLKNLWYFKRHDAYVNKFSNSTITINHLAN